MNENYNHIHQGKLKGDNRQIFSVSEISQALKRAVENNFPHIRVRGEISRCVLARSGHIYMSLKDENSVLDAVCWKGTASRLSTKPEDGIEVIVTGRLTTYPGRSNYQIVIEQLEIAGEGALLKLLEERRKKLFAEGLFDQKTKKELPYLPECIGVVTSLTGVVIRDILHRLEDRFPRHVLLWPVNVQGESASNQIAEAIVGFNNMDMNRDVPKPDLIIVARGGGSLEDLWAFNEEIVVRAVAASKIPLISAVGHETDTTLIDFASDKRAPTPTAAAEMAVPVRTDLGENIAISAVRLQRAVNSLFEKNRRNVESSSRRLPDLRRITEEATQRLDDRFERLTVAKEFYLKNLSSKVLRLSSGLISPLQHVTSKHNQLVSLLRAWHRGLGTFIEKKNHQLDKSVIKLESVSFQRVLDRGFALVTNELGQPLLSSSSVKLRANINIKFGDGDVDALVLGKDQLKATTTNKIRKRSENSDEGSQGSLL